ncbi:MAG: aspartate kinase [Sphingobacteriia bacterium]|nr:aspartate kinase [Sphingobacteriia bacterium]
MKIFKFGGASVKDAAAVRNMVAILEKYKTESLIVIVSAMGKTTNALEKLLDAHFYDDSSMNIYLEEIKTYHRTIISELFTENHPIHPAVDSLFKQLEHFMSHSAKREYDFEYDQIVCFGELISTTIISHYLNQEMIHNNWIDARQWIRTDHSWRNAHINWEVTQDSILKGTTPYLNKSKSTILVTQGFIGSTPEGSSITLGREGSDFTASIFAWALDAEAVTIWKDVPGLLNADPKFVNDATKFDRIPYEEAVELSYYGASIIHPKTIKPLENKKIPLHIKSFLNPLEEGTVIGSFTEASPQMPSYIFKTNQVLITISAKDFSFIAEKHLREIFGVFSKHSLHINLMQNSALSFSICADYNQRRIENVINDLKNSFNVSLCKELKLVTVRHYDTATIEKVTNEVEILVEQKSKLTAQWVIR